MGFWGRSGPSIRFKPNVRKIFWGEYWGTIFFLPFRGGGFSHLVNFLCGGGQIKLSGKRREFQNNKKTPMGWERGGQVSWRRKNFCASLGKKQTLEESLREDSPP